MLLCSLARVSHRALRTANLSTKRGLVCGDANAKKISCIPSSVDRFLVLSFVTMSSASRIEYSEKYADDVNEYR